MNRDTCVRPPWARPEAEFSTRCVRCADCAAVCPENIIIDGDGGYPEVDFSRGACTFCARCADACEHGALGHVDGATPWLHEASVSSACLAHKGVVCRVCGDACATRAITFELQTGGCSRPRISAARCTGCGACVAPCPVSAIRIQAQQRNAHR